MPSVVSAFTADKNQYFGPHFIFLFEMTYDVSDPVNPAILRFAKYDKPVLFEGVEWSPFPLAGIEVTESLSGELPAFDIAITNAGRLMMSVLENNTLDEMTGRILWVHPNHLTDTTAKKQVNFSVVSARADVNNAILTVAPFAVDILQLMVPKGNAAIDDFPGMVGDRARFMV